MVICTSCILVLTSAVGRKYDYYANKIHAMIGLRTKKGYPKGPSKAQKGRKEENILQVNNNEVTLSEKKVSEYG